LIEKVKHRREKELKRSNDSDGVRERKRGERSDSNGLQLPQCTQRRITLEAQETSASSGKFLGLAN
jgi:hypothetical protein